MYVSTTLFSTKTPHFLLSTSPLSPANTSITIITTSPATSPTAPTTPQPPLPPCNRQLIFSGTIIQAMSLRVRPPTTVTAVSTASSDSDDEPESPELVEPPSPQTPSSTITQRALSQTLTSTAQLANRLPTGSLLALQLLTPIFTNNGSCDAATRPLTFLLLFFLAGSCFLASFTDSFKASNGQVYYGLATFKGMWLFDYQAAAASGSGLPDLKKYKMGFIDWIHAIASVLVFLVLALRDKNVVSCFYPQPSQEAQEVLNIVPIGIGLICSLLFIIFPTRRHGIGYPVTHSQ